MRPGMVVARMAQDCPSFTVKYVDFADSVSQKRSSIVLSFVEHPTLARLYELFPIGSMIELSEPSVGKPSTAC
jgi:hypothetical protein